MLAVLDDLIGVTGWELALRKHELTPEGIEKGIAITTGDRALAALEAAKARMADERAREAV